MRFAALTLLLLIAGCSSVEWRKPGIDAEARRQEMIACRQISRAQAQNEVLPRAFASPTYVAIDARGNPVTAQAPTRENELMLVEQNLMHACMRGKGYTLTSTDRSPEKTEKSSAPASHAPPAPQ